MRNSKVFYVISGAFAAIALALLMAPATGGFPSRPRFQTLIVGTGAASTQVGEVSFRGTENGAHDFIVDNDSNDTANQARLLTISGDAQVQIQAGGSGRTVALMTNGTIGAAAAIKTFTAVPLEFGTGNTLAASISAAQVFDFVNTPTVGGFDMLFASDAGAGGALGFAFVRFNTAGTILSDRNVATVSDVAGTGVWDVNFDAPAFSAAPFCSCTTTAAGQCAQVGTLSAATARFETRGATGTLADLGAHVQCFQ